MAELILRANGSYGTSDIIARFDDQTTVGQLADRLEQAFDRPGDTPRTIHRQSRGGDYLPRTSRLSQSDLRSGDTICLALDTGLRDNGKSPAVATLQVVDGPDAGRQFELPRGESTIGRSSRCEVTLKDAMASRRHVIIRVSDIVEVADAGSTNGATVNDVLLEAPRRIRPGDRLVIGDSTLVIDLLGGDHEAIDMVGNSVGFNRPPRIDRPFQPIKIQLPTPVDPPRKPRIPLISALVPLLMGAAMYYFTRNLATVALVALSPLMVMGNFFETKRSAVKEQKEKQAEFDATLHDRKVELDQARQDEVDSRFRFSPSPNELGLHVNDLSPRLWEREPEDTDFLQLRIGLIEQRSQTTIDVGHGGKRDQRLELGQLAKGYEMLPPVPITVDARFSGPVGVAGPHGPATSVARAILLEAAALHSPTELALGAIISDSAEGDSGEWDWLKWLPHTRSSSPLSRPLTAVGVDEGFELLAALQELILERVGHVDHRPTERKVFVPHVLLLIDGSIGIDRPRFARLLEQGADVGISVIWIANDSRRLPNACQSVIEIEPGGTTVSLGDRLSGSRTSGIPLEGVTLETAEAVARALAPIVDISAGGDTADLPSSVGLVELLGGLEIFESPRSIIDRWHQGARSKGGALRAPVGRYADGPLTIDLRIDGPHGLVAGTTGAGKSEFLQALVASLAATHSPDRVNFLLVDYKGGSAFGPLVDQFDDDGRRIWRGLHHTVGMITDLTPALVERALHSLRAELLRREHILNDYRAKDLAEMEKREIPNTPPSLLIIVDEFAALAKEVPAFVEGVVDIAQRGRSLGLHLLLATQRPAGVITANIQANTNLRVALRTADTNESTNVIDSPAAGLIDRSTPGRGMMRRGPSDLVAFQSAYVGGVTTPAGEAMLELGKIELGRTHWLRTENDNDATAAADTEPDLKRLIRLINAAADSDGVGMPRRPWLDPLPDRISLLGDLPRGASDTAIPYGLADIPGEQRRDLAVFRPDEAGSLLIYGRGGSGKTVALRTLAASFGLTAEGSPVHVYGLDFAGRGLEMLEPLPHVGSIIPGDDYERVTRLFSDLTAEVDRRAGRFATAKASTLSEYRRSTRGSPDLARIVVLLDGYDNFLASYERIDRGRWAEMVPQLVANGRAFGLHFLLTGTRRSSFPMNLASQIQSRLVFAMASDDDYHSVGANPRWFDDDTPAGRCRVGPIEIQVALLGSDPLTAAEANLFARTGAAMVKRGKSQSAPPVQVLPDKISLDSLASMADAGWLLSDDFTVITPGLSESLLIAGRARSGKTTALQSLIELTRNAGTEVEVFAADPRRFTAATARPGGTDIGDFEALNQRLQSNQAGLVFIDDADRLSGTAAEMAFRDAVAAGTLTAVITADADTARSFDQTFKTIRSRSEVLVLQPSPDVDGDLLGEAMPRTERPFPPGRGYYRSTGGAVIVQVAITG